MSLAFASIFLEVGMVGVDRCRRGLERLLALRLCLQHCSRESDGVLFVARAAQMRAVVAQCCSHC